jgi:serine/threonine-protein kinase
VGDGGEGLVYRAVGDFGGEEREVALKMVTSLSFDDYERLAERASVMAQIEHPNIMRQVETFVGTALIDSDDLSDDDFEVIYSVADWVPGEPLSQALDRSDASQGLSWVAQIARAVAFLHSYRCPGAPEGVVHRDIKPSNVRITPEGEAVLIDFGIARPHTHADHTEGVGTYLWRAPEIVGGPGKPGLESDNWGIGALAYWVLVGEPPRLEGAPVAQERLLHVADESFPQPEVLSRHIASLLETVPDRRPDDLDYWANALEALIAGNFAPRTGKRRVSILAALTVAIVSIVATVWLVTSRPSNSPSSILLARQYTSIARSLNDAIRSDSTGDAFGSGVSQLLRLSVPSDMRSGLRRIAVCYATEWGDLTEAAGLTADLQTAESVWRREPNWLLLNTANEQLTLLDEQYLQDTARTNDYATSLERVAPCLAQPR